MLELENFYNKGFGWICRRCEADLAAQETAAEGNETLPRVWREGEAESKTPRLAAPLAKWFDASRRQLLCPRCGTVELVNQA